MPERWIQFAVVLENVSKEEEDWMDVECLSPTDRAKCFEEEGYTVETWRSEHKEIDEEFEDSWPGCEIERTDSKSPSCVALCMEEASDFDLKMTTLFIQRFLKKFRPDEIVTVSYAVMSDKMRADGFGGGAFVVSADSIEWLDVPSWIASTGRSLKDLAERPRGRNRKLAISMSPKFYVDCYGSNNVICRALHRSGASHLYQRWLDSSTRVFEDNMQDDTSAGSIEVGTIVDLIYVVDALGSEEVEITVVCRAEKDGHSLEVSLGSSDSSHGEWICDTDAVGRRLTKAASQALDLLQVALRGETDE